MLASRIQCEAGAIEKVYIVNPTCYSVVDPHLLKCGEPHLLKCGEPHLLKCGGPPPALLCTLDPHLLQYVLLQEKSPGLTLCPAAAWLRVRPSFRTI
ncbi:unnamed protein product [Boreogadus saida]